MADTVHTSHIKIVQDAPPLRRAFIEDFEEPFYYSIHGGIAEFYGRPPKGDHPATLDHMIAAVAGWLTGTFAGALEARKISTNPDNLYATVEGDIGPVDKTIKITEIRVTYHVRVPEDKKAEAERSLDFHPSRCPAYQSIKGSIPVKIDADFEWV